jgi:hypothetical protein
VTGALGRSRPDLGDFQPATLKTLPEAVARNVAIARARTRTRHGGAQIRQVQAPHQAKPSPWVVLHRQSATPAHLAGVSQYRRFSDAGSWAPRRLDSMGGLSSR